MKAATALNLASETHGVHAGQLPGLQVAPEAEEPPNLQGYNSVDSGDGHMMVELGQHRVGPGRSRTSTGQITQQPQWEYLAYIYFTHVHSPAVAMADHHLVLGQANSMHDGMKLNIDWPDPGNSH